VSTCLLTSKSELILKFEGPTLDLSRTPRLPNFRDVILNFLDLDLWDVIQDNVPYIRNRFAINRPSIAAFILKGYS